MTVSIGCSMAFSLLILAACGENQQSVAPKEPLPEIETVRPTREFSLVASDGTMLDPRDVVDATDALLILDETADDIWRLSRTPPYELRRITQPRLFGQVGVFALTSHPAGVSLIGVDGTIRVMERDAPNTLARTIRAFELMQRPIALGAWTDDGWIAVHALLVLQGTAAADSVIVSIVDSLGRVTRHYAFERTGPSRQGSFIVDRMSARALDNRVVIVGAEPARVITITTTSISVDTLLDAPVRRLNESEREGLQRMQSSATTPQMLREARTPEQRPAVLDALPFESGYLVVAQGGEDAEFVDLYCGRTFRRTVLARASLRRVFVTSHGLAAVDERVDASSDAPATLSYYQTKDFIAECAK